MPRETIGRMEQGGFVVQVGWDHAGSVQVGVGDPAGPTGDPAASLWSNLGRSEINWLIRVLRRARNAAYGGDE